LGGREIQRIGIRSGFSIFNLQFAICNLKSG
jgi:hypothetical protein